MTFGESLKKVRAEKNISQGQLAEMVGIHSTHISRYERDLTKPTIEIVKKLAESLEVSVDYLIYGKLDQKAQSNIKDSELLRLFSKIQTLNSEDVSVVKSLLNAYILKTDLQQKLAS